MRNDTHQYDEPSARDFSFGTQTERGYTGRMHERDLFGEINTSGKNFQKDMERLGSKPNGYLKYRQAVELAKLHQPADAANPNKDFLKNLLVEVQDRLAKYKDLTVEGAFTAVNTPLDRFHGTDAFVSGKFRGEDWTVGLDASIRPEKLQDAMRTGQNEKGAIVVGNIVPPEENEDVYLMQIDDVAEKITRKLLEQIDADEPRTMAA